MSAELRAKILKYDRLVPRYTSYPTAPHFKQADDTTAKDSRYREWIAALPEQASLSLYLHVPFCSKMCWYCGCHTKVTQRYAPVEDYAHLMLREIDMLADILPSGHRIHHIHFGGGSPGMLRSCDFEKVMERIRAGMHLHEQAEIAIEVDPRGLTEGRAATYAQQGVNRISLGVQDFDDKVLESVNRQQPFELSEKAVRLFRENGITRFNFDLLYGLPHQTLDTMSATIDKALSLDPDRVSLFGYAHVPWMKKHMRLIDEGALPDKEMRYDLFELGAQKLQQAGYVAIGIDHFAKAGDSLAIAAKSGRLHRNFQGYTTEQTDALVGIGASAIGKLPQGYVQNAVDMPHYEAAILDGRLGAQKYCPMSAEDHLRGDLIERLMCDFTVDVAAVCTRHGVPVDHLDGCFAALDDFIAEGFMTLTDRVITVDPAAKHMVRIVCSAFDAYMAKLSDTPRHAKAI